MVFQRRNIITDKISYAELHVLSGVALTEEIELNTIVDSLVEKGLIDKNNKLTDSAKKFLYGGTNPVHPNNIPKNWAASFGKLHTRLLYTLTRYLVSLLAAKDKSGYEKLVEEMTNCSTEQMALIHEDMDNRKS